MKWRTVLCVIACLSGIGVITTQASEPGALLAAAEKGDLPMLKQALANGAKPDTRNPANGWTALLYAAKRGDLEMAKVLAASGADLNAQSSTKPGSRVLQFAVPSGNVKLLEFLIGQGARLELQSRDGSTALHYAATHGHIEATKLLLAEGANPNQYTYRNEFGNVFTPFLGAILNGDTNMAGLLLAHGADIEKRNNRGNTALMEAAKLEDPTALIWLLAHKAKVDARAHYGHTAFLYAAYNGRTANLKLLLDAGADPLVKATDSQEPDYDHGYGAETLAREQGHPEALAIVREAQERAKHR